VRSAESAVLKTCGWLAMTAVKALSGTELNEDTPGAGTRPTDLLELFSQEEKR
jgi:hypothetical protein